MNEARVQVRRYLGRDAIRYVVPREDLERITRDGGRGYRLKLRLFARLQRRGHCVYFDIPRICTTAKYDFDYDGCRFRFVNVIDAFGSPHPCIISGLGAARNRITVEMNDWTFPKSGVAFVWVLEEEMTESFVEMSRETMEGRQTENRE